MTYVVLLVSPNLERSASDITTTDPLFRRVCHYQASFGTVFLAILGSNRSRSTIVRLPDTVVLNNPIWLLRSLWFVAFGCMRTSTTRSIQATSTCTVGWKRENNLMRHREKYNDELYRQGLL